MWPRHVFPYEKMSGQHPGYNHAILNRGLSLISHWEYPDFTSSTSSLLSIRTWKQLSDCFKPI